MVTLHECVLNQNKIPKELGLFYQLLLERRSSKALIFPYDVILVHAFVYSRHNSCL